jgi:subtilisin family serine protease
MRKQLLVSLVLIMGCREYGQADVGIKLNRSKIDLPKVYKVAVIDTGLDSSLMNKSWICAEGHKDFTGEGLVDNHGHGTHISGLVDQYAKDFIFTKAMKQGQDLKDIDKIQVNYCQIIIKYYDPKAPGDNLKNTIKAFRWAIDQKVDIINYSGGGTDASAEEKALVQEALNKGIKFVAAAGNERSDIDKHKYYPAMYDTRISIVANLVDLHSREIASSSNRGKSINTFELGTDVLSRLPDGRFGRMTGTSQAAAIHTGKLVRKQLSNGN